MMLGKKYQNNFQKYMAHDILVGRELELEAYEIELLGTCKFYFCRFD